MILSNKITFTFLKSIPEEIIMKNNNESPKIKAFLKTSYLIRNPGSDECECRIKKIFKKAK